MSLGKLLPVTERSRNYKVTETATVHQRKKKPKDQQTKGLRMTPHVKILEIVQNVSHCRYTTIIYASNFWKFIAGVKVRLILLLLK